MYFPKIWNTDRLFMSYRGGGAIEDAQQYDESSLRMYMPLMVVVKLINFGAMNLEQWV